MKKLLVIPVLALMTGCCLFRKPEVVYVQAPPPPVVAEPVLRTAALPATATWVEIVQAYTLDLAEWVAYGRRLQILTWGKTTPTPLPEIPK